MRIVHKYVKLLNFSSLDLFQDVYIRISFWPMRRLNGIYNVLVLETPHQEEQSVIQIHRESPEATGGDLKELANSEWRENTVREEQLAVV